MIKLPRTLHIEGSRTEKGEVDPDAVEFATLKGEFLVVEEKLDGSGVSIFFDSDLNIQVWHRGSPAIGKEFDTLKKWAQVHTDEIFDVIGHRFILFGEWMMNKHTIFYDQIPINPTTSYPFYFLESDIFDIQAHIFLSTSARHGLISSHPLIRSVPVLKSFRPNSLSELTNLIGKPAFQSSNWQNILAEKVKEKKLNFDQVIKETDQSSLMEGLYIKHESDRHVIGRYKYVRPEFLQTILKSGTHVMDRPIIPNSFGA